MASTWRIWLKNLLPSPSFSACAFTIQQCPVNSNCGWYRLFRFNKFWYFNQALIRDQQSRRRLQRIDGSEGIVSRFDTCFCNRIEWVDFPTLGGPTMHGYLCQCHSLFLLASVFGRFSLIFLSFSKSRQFRSNMSTVTIWFSGCRRPPRDNLPTTGNLVVASVRTFISIMSWKIMVFCMAVALCWASLNLAGDPHTGWRVRSGFRIIFDLSVCMFSCRARCCWSSWGHGCQAFFAVLPHAS